jgi:hypothetical protein
MLRPTAAIAFRLTPVNLSLLGESLIWRRPCELLFQAPSPIAKLTGVSQCQTLASCTGAADEVKTTATRGTPGVANNLQVTSISFGAGDGSLTATSTMTYNVVHL